MNLDFAESDTLKSFCELCDGSKFEGPFYSSGKKLRYHNNYLFLALKLIY